MKNQIDNILEKQKQDQDVFENHELWQKLKTTPREFFAELDIRVAESGIPRHVWEQKLTETKQIIETRVRETHGLYRHSTRNLAYIRL